MTAAGTHQAAQAAIAASAARQVASLWQYIDLARLKTSLPEYATAVSAVTQQHGRAASSLAASFYEARRQESDVRGSFRVAPAEPAGTDQITSAIDWATKGLWSKSPDVEGSQKLVTGVVEKYSLDPGRFTIIDAVHNDRQSTGWARSVEPGACSFCLLLATRGAIYRSERTADFRSHDHCRCHVEPLFGPYEPSAEIRRAQALYRSVKGTVRGPAAVRRAFRQAVEGDRSKS